MQGYLLSEVEAWDVFENRLNIGAWSHAKGSICVHEGEPNSKAKSAAYRNTLT